MTADGQSDQRTAPEHFPSEPEMAMDTEHFL